MEKDACSLCINTRVFKIHSNKVTEFIIYQTKFETKLEDSGRITKSEFYKIKMPNNSKFSNWYEVSDIFLTKKEAINNLVQTLDGNFKVVEA